MNSWEQSGLARFFIRIDKMIEAFAIVLIIAMVLIVFTQVMTRKLFNFVFFWSEEVTLLCLTWFSFIGIGIGFREKLHIGMDMVEKSPAQVRTDGSGQGDRRLHVWIRTLHDCLRHAVLDTHVRIDSSCH